MPLLFFALTSHAPARLITSLLSVHTEWTNIHVDPDACFKLRVDDTYPRVMQIATGNALLGVTTKKPGILRALF